MRQWDNQTIGDSENGNSPRKRKVARHTDLEVYQRAFAAAMTVFRFSKNFPAEEKYSLIDQVRRSSRSVCGNLAEGWRKRRYAASFVNKLNDGEGEAAETQSWIQFAVECGYLTRTDARSLYADYDDIIGMLVKMQNDPKRWTLTPRE